MKTQIKIVRLRAEILKYEAGLPTTTPSLHISAPAEEDKNI